MSAASRLKVLNSTDIALIAIFTGVSFVCTNIQVKLPVGGFNHIGDIGWIIPAILFGGLVGGLSGSLGCSLADIYSGSAIWAPFTLAIKFASANVIALITNGRSMKRNVIALICGYLCNATLYFLVYLWLFGIYAALFFYPLCLLQGAVVGAISLFVVHGIVKVYPPIVDYRTTRVLRKRIKLGD
ncbi:ECF transporter S component [Candidatus Bathyarchaeota archaeon]|nr:ECF transporter S component [Candidatus Bathyarchaeota archaeon]